MLKVIAKRCFSLSYKYGTLSSHLEHLIETKELANLLEAKEKVRVLDCSYYFPEENKNAITEHIKNRIPTSLHFDLGQLMTTRGPNPYVIPKIDQFAVYAQKLNLKATDHVVCYDQVGISTSPRIWWTLKYFGFENVRVLDGGFPKWIELGLPTIKNTPEVTIEGTKDKFKINGNLRTIFKRVRSMEILINRDLILDRIIDFRPANYSETSEPIKDPKVKRDCIYGAVNIPPENLLNGDKITLKSPKELYFYFTDSKIDITKPIVAYSRTNIGACIGLLGLAHASAEKISLYDGSWLQYVTKPVYNSEAELPPQEEFEKEVKETLEDD
jgi:thiosulfate/3-mercaptopyruvate sulfurtransferase